MQAHAQGVLAVGGVIEVGVVVIIKDDALVGKLIEGGGQLRVDDGGGEALGAQDDQVIVGKHAGVLILLCAGQAGDVVVDGFDLFVLCQGVQIVKVDIQHIIAVFHRGVRVLRLGLGGHGNVVVVLPLLGLGRASRQVQPQGRQQAETLGGLVRGGQVVMVKIVVGEQPRAANRKASRCAELQHDEQHQQANPPKGVGGDEALLAENAQQDDGHQG